MFRLPPHSTRSATLFPYTTLFRSLVSIVTPPRFATTDYNLWGGFALLVFFFLTFVGGCTGSTAGGIKIFRFQVGALLLLAQIKRLAHPNTVFVRKFGGRALGEDVIRSEERRVGIECVSTWCSRWLP